MMQQCIHLLKRSTILILITLITLFTIVLPADSASGSDPEQLSEKYSEQLAELARYMKQRGFDLEPHYEDSRFEIYEGISNRFTGSPERSTPTLDEYKEILNFEDKTSRIAEFIDRYQDHLSSAEETYGISRYVISAILAVESDFGRVTGRYNPFNVYVSMIAEDYRSTFARAQLEELLIFARDRQLDIFEMNSSYAGAMTAAQFIPYSLNRWFVGDDLTDMSDNIHSVANYLAHFKKITGTIDGAVHRYNPSTLYTRTVLDMANKAESGD
ncbi:MAG: lytic murein transglycosylase [Balneolaceae bacterium]